MRPYLFALLLSLMLSTTPAHAETEAVQTGRLLALLLDCGRVTVAANQTLIDNPEKGFKGFTPESFEQQLIAVFKERSGIDLTDLDHAEIPPMAKPLPPINLQLTSLGSSIRGSFPRPLGPKPPHDSKRGQEFT